jgi:hypothetical protein
MIVSVLAALLCAYLARDMADVRQRGPAATNRRVRRALASRNSGTD